jgi:hypothetical protein
MQDLTPLAWHSATVRRARPQLAAICRSLKPAALSRSTSRILRMDNLALGTVDLVLWKDKAERVPWWCHPAQTQLHSDRRANECWHHGDE